MFWFACANIRSILISCARLRFGKILQYFFVFHVASNSEGFEALKMRILFFHLNEIRLTFSLFVPLKLWLNHNFIEIESNIFRLMLCFTQSNNGIQEKTRKT